MDFANNIANLRKEKGLSRDQLGKLVGTSGAIIGRYERGDMKPSIEIATKIANALEVSLDYLVGASSVLIKDKKMAYRLELLQKLGQEQRDKILYVLDTLLKDAQTNDVQQKLAQ